jgi:hypothetical protein
MCFSDFIGATSTAALLALPPFDPPSIDWKTVLIMQRDVIGEAMRTLVRGSEKPELDEHETKFSRR